VASKADCRRLKIPIGVLTHRQLWLLKNEAGYSIISEDEKFMELTRPKDFVRKKHTPELAEFQKTALNNRLNHILDMYIEPWGFRDEITTRIRNICRTLSPLEQDYCWEWVERNIG
jgi:hypothetical protein